MLVNVLFFPELHKPESIIQSQLLLSLSNRVESTEWKHEIPQCWDWRHTPPTSSLKTALTALMESSDCLLTAYSWEVVTALNSSENSIYPFFFFFSLCVKHLENLIHCLSTAKANLIGSSSGIPKSSQFYTSIYNFD